MSLEQFCIFDYDNLDHHPFTEECRMVDAKRHLLHTAAQFGNKHFISPKSNFDASLL